MSRKTPQITARWNDKKIRGREILSKYLQQLVEKWNLATYSMPLIHSKHQEQDRRGF